MELGDQNSYRSSHREMVLEHLFLGQLLRHLWLAGASGIEVLKPSVDDAGYDIVVRSGERERYIQLKSSKSGAVAASQKFSLGLFGKPGGCIVWFFFNEDLEFDEFLFLDLEGLSPEELRVARHTKANAEGIKNERPNHRVVPKRRFSKVSDMASLASLLFPDNETKLGRLPGGPTQYTAIIDDAGDGSYWAICPEVPGANGQGRTIEDTKEDLVAAIKLVLEYHLDEATSEMSATAIKDVVFLD